MQTIRMLVTVLAVSLLAACNTNELRVPSCEEFAVDLELAESVCDDGVITGDEMLGDAEPQPSTPPNTPETPSEPTGGSPEPETPNEPTQEPAKPSEPSETPDEADTPAPEPPSEPQNEPSEPSEPQEPTPEPTEPPEPSEEPGGADDGDEAEEAPGQPEEDETLEPEVVVTYEAYWRDDRCEMVVWVEAPHDDWGYLLVDYMYNQEYPHQESFLSVIGKQQFVLAEYAREARVEIVAYTKDGNDIVSDSIFRYDPVHCADILAVQP